MGSILATLAKVENVRVFDYLDAYMEGLIEAYYLGREYGAISRSFYFLPEQSYSRALVIGEIVNSDDVCPTLGPVRGK